MKSKWGYCVKICKFFNFFLISDGTQSSRIRQWCHPSYFFPCRQTRWNCQWRICRHAHYWPWCLLGVARKQFSCWGCSQDWMLKGSWVLSQIRHLNHQRPKSWHERQWLVHWPDGRLFRKDWRVILHRRKSWWHQAWMLLLSWSNARVYWKGTRSPREAWSSLTCSRGYTSVSTWASTRRQVALHVENWWKVRWRSSRLPSSNPLRI
jgi:hypothetical protein